MSTLYPIPKKLSPPRSTLEGMLREALANTGATPATSSTSHPATPKSHPEQKRARPLPQKFEPAMPGAHEIAMAIVLASRALGADPISVARGEPNRSDNYSTSRARAFAAFMLVDRYQLPWRTVARYVGSSETSLIMTKSQRLKGKVKWWNERLFRQLCRDLEARLDRVA